MKKNRHSIRNAGFLDDLPGSVRQRERDDFRRA